MAEFLQFVFAGLTTGAVYALVALGFTLIYNSCGVINFAQGEFVMLGGMGMVFLTHAGVPLPLAACIAILGTMLVGTGNSSARDRPRAARQPSRSSSLPSVPPYSCAAPRKYFSTSASTRCLPGSAMMRS